MIRLIAVWGDSWVHCNALIAERWIFYAMYWNEIPHGALGVNLLLIKVLIHRLF